MTQDTITKADFNAAVAAHIPLIKAPLLQLEADVAVLGLAPDHPVITSLLNLHQALAAAVNAADALGEADGAHTESGGSDKGDGA